MPSKKADNSKFAVEAPAAIEADSLLLVGITPVAHFYKDGEDQASPASGNLQIGDTLATDASGDFIKTELMGVSYIACNGDQIVKMGTVKLTPEQLAELMGNQPGARDVVKLVGYDALQIVGLAPADAVVS